MNTVNYSQPDKSLFASGGLAELVDAYALGAYDFGHESSSLLSPTRKQIDRQVSFWGINKTSEVTILDETNLLHEMLHLLKDVAESLRKVKWVWFIRDWLVLGKNHPTHIHSLLHILLQYQCLFFKQSVYALVNSFCNKCNKTTSLLYFYCNKNHKCMYLI
jgi:hypothetical protein